MKEFRGFLPLARRDGLIRKEVDGELLVYDRERNQAHCLNGSAAAIFKLCDGHTPVKEIAASLTKEVGATVDERVVWLALTDLRRTHLLDEARSTLASDDSNRSNQKQKNDEWPRVTLGMSRREAVRRIGLGVAIALPVVISITAPTPAQALSCVQAGGGCTTTAECCPNMGLVCNGSNVCA
ncbi:MAG TPA: PqqD family protein [Pyrinomonadaceae bacterium]|nr:PqqD family protein [Pyrinomonadaceae bacterium]